MLGNELLEGQSVRLTALTRGDLAQLAQWRDNIELRRLMDGQLIVPVNLDHVQDWYDQMRQDRNRYLFAIRTLAENRFLGYCNVRGIQWQPRWGKIGMMIGDPAQWGRGYGTDATRVLLKFCFMELALNRVQLRVLSYNARAIRCYQKVGFQHEGVLREAMLRDGQYVDIVQMSILRREWAALYLDRVK